jgi:aldehyde dehydrogenase (NAD+)
VGHHHRVHTDLAGAARASALAGLAAHHPLLADGVPTAGGGAVLTIVDPSTGLALTEVATADGRDVDSAVRAARRTHDRAWGRIPGVQRGQALLRLAREVRDHADALAVLESLGTGIPLRQTRERDLPEILAHLVHHAGWADKLAHAGYGPGPDGNGPRPLGVVAVLVPPSSSLVLAVRIVAAALAAGNAAVLVPAAASPLAALALAELARVAELPPGLLTVLPGGPDVRTALVDHPGTSSVTVTGDRAAAAAVQRQLAGRATRLVLELRGPATTVVLADGDPVRAAAGLAHSLTAHHQLAGAGSRVLVDRAVAQALTEALREQVAGLRVGDALAPGTDVGPLATADQRDEALRALEGAQGEVWTGPHPVPEQGFFLAPALHTDPPAPLRGSVDPGGPVLSVHVVDGEDGAVALAQLQPGTLGVWTADAVRPAALARRLRRDVVQDGCPVPALGHGGGPVPLGGYLDVQR